MNTEAMVLTTLHFLDHLNYTFLERQVIRVNTAWLQLSQQISLEDITNEYKICMPALPPLICCMLIQVTLSCPPVYGFHCISYLGHIQAHICQTLTLISACVYWVFWWYSYWLYSCTQGRCSTEFHPWYIRMGEDGLRFCHWSDANV